MFENAFMVLPKLSAYRFKDDFTRKAIESKVEHWMTALTNMGVKYVFCFAEDELAINLLAGRQNVRFISVLGKSDAIYMKSAYTEDEYKVYKECINKTVKATIIDEAVSRYKAPILGRGVTDMTEYNGKRYAVLNNRIRHACNAHLETQRFVVFVDSNNGFCNMPEPSIGDGKAILKVGLYENEAFISFGGIPLPEEIFISTMRGVLNGNNV